MATSFTRTFPVRVRVLATLVAAILAVSTIELFAHRVIGVGDPIGHRALVQSPNPAPAVDMPIPVFDTGLSVACFRVTNTSLTGARITAIGLELSGELSGFALVSPLDRGLSIQENVEVPGFPGVALDFAVVTGPNFTGGRPQLGLAPQAPPTLICVSGPFPNEPIETMLNGVFVGFRGGEGAGNASDVGVWERR